MTLEQRFFMLRGMSVQFNEQVATYTKAVMRDGLCTQDQLLEALFDLNIGMGKLMGELALKETTD